MDTKEEHKEEAISNAELWRQVMKSLNDQKVELTLQLNKLGERAVADAICSASLANPFFGVRE